ncbi:MAG: hypothetical protein ACRDTT_00880 [Pseudonocardiaceae bacterium]
MGLDPNQHQGLFGESLVRVLASAAGLIVARAELDMQHIRGRQSVLGSPTRVTTTSGTRTVGG